MITCKKVGTAETAWWLRAFVLAEYTGLVPSNYMVGSQSSITTVFQGLQLPLLTSEGTRHACGIQAYMHVKHS